MALYLNTSHESTISLDDKHRLISANNSFFIREVKNGDGFVEYKYHSNLHITLDVNNT